LPALPSSSHPRVVASFFLPRLSISGNRALIYIQSCLPSWCKCRILFAESRDSNWWTCPCYVLTLLDREVFVLQTDAREGSIFQCSVISRGPLQPPRLSLAPRRFLAFWQHEKWVGRELSCEFRALLLMTLGVYDIAFVFVLLELATVSLAIRGRECQRYLACAEA
jgi:hypothetical protein